MTKRKTALVLIHGIGEQRPMDTLWQFVGAAWVHDRQLVNESRSEVWSKPDESSKSFELRRVTTREGSFGDKRRFDFFEFYWAHHMQGHTVGGLARWTLSLFLRRPSSVPKGLHLAWAVGVLLVTAAAAIAVVALATDLARSLGIPDWLVVAAPIALAAGGFVTQAVLLPYAGDAARYLSPEPGNVEVRQKIRENGVSLIKELTSSGQYDRIVIAGHSLGSVIAYDIVNFAWNRLDGDGLAKLHIAGGPAMAALNALEEAARALAAPEENSGHLRSVYRDAQRQYAAILADGDAPLWLVSDLVTLGSPLSKADILLGRDGQDLSMRIDRREVPSCPPAFESEDGVRRFSYPLDAAERRPHHGAVFAPVIWTNIYHPNWLIWFGDIISGRVRNLFGRGVLDVRLPIGRPPGFRHLDYWRQAAGEPAPAAVRALRRAINLRGRKFEKELWGAQSDAGEIDGLSLPAEI